MKVTFCVLVILAIVAILLVDDADCWRRRRRRGRRRRSGVSRPSPPPKPRSTPPKQQSLKSAAPTQPPHPSTDVFNFGLKYKYVGCYLAPGHAPPQLKELLFTERDQSSPVWNGNLIDWYNWDTYFPNLIKRCAEKAYGNGYKVFGLKHNGECYGDKSVTDAEAVFIAAMKQPSECVKEDFEDCKDGDPNCVGKHHGLAVYQIIPATALKMTDLTMSDPLPNEDDSELLRSGGNRKRCSISPANLLAISHFFSAWGDRMWMFAVGLYLVELTPNSLRLTAIYGLAVSFSVVLFASAVGHWVDINARLTVVRVSLLVQNLLVCASALVILAILFRKPGHPALLKVCEASIIILGSLANLASQANTIAVERDWVVVVSDDDKNLLAELNARMRRIDLSCAILAPIAVGLIMTLVSNLAGIIFICAWNVLSFFAEYNLLLRVYRAVPRLAVKDFQSLHDGSRRGSVESIYDNDEFSKILHEDETAVIDTRPRSRHKCCWLLCNRFRNFYNGWKIYFNQSVALAGTSLAFIYLTVLGFSAVTTGYAYTQRLSGVIVSVCFAIGSLMGIVGTFLFPRARKRFGLVKTGLVSFALQWSMLIFCVVSIWMPGSPSDLYSKHIHLWQQQQQHQQTAVNAPINSTVLTMTPLPTSSGLFMHSQQLSKPKFLDVNKGGRKPSTFIPSQSRNITASQITPATPREQEKFSYISISLLMLGLLLSRIGLWMTDLTVTQLLQENVAEKHRGVVSGTQSAFNAVLDMLHYVLTIALPSPNQFGILTLISFGAISLGFLSYIIFYWRKSHLVAVRGERGIGSVSSFEWSRDDGLAQDADDVKGMALLDGDEEEIVRGKLYLQDSIEN
eukprot:gene3608-4118_t